MATTPDYTIDYEDKRLNDVKLEETSRLTENEQTYNGMINSTDKFYQDQINASNAWADKQSQLQQEQTDFTIQQIEQQKEQAQKDYTKEQAGAYVDWRKQSNQYGTEAEKMASAGLSNTGFSESSQVSMYNTYQNRVATARESYNQAVMNYNNKITEARLQNNAALAEIAYNALQTQLELSLQGFQYKNQLISEMTDKKLQIQQLYNDKWKTQLDVMNKEIDRQWQADQNELTREHDKAMAEINHKYDLERDRINNEFSAKEAELDRKHDLALVEANTKAAKEEADHAHKLAMDKLKQEHANALEKLDKELANEKALAKYEYDLANSNTTYRTSKSSSSGNFVYDNSKKFLDLKQNAANIAKKTAFTGSTYKEASAYLKSKGVSNGAMTESEWSRRKNSYSMTGIGAEEVKRFSTYKAYIQAYVKYRTGG